MKKNIFILIFIAWVVIWASFNIREIFVKNNINDYRILMSRTLEGKKSYILGDRLYEFLTFCNDKLPVGAGYMWTKTDKEDLNRRRATYCLYPHIEREDADFILVYDNPGFTRSGYNMFAGMDGARYILVRKGRGR